MISIFLISSCSKETENDFSISSQVELNKESDEFLFKKLYCDIYSPIVADATDRLVQEHNNELSLFKNKFARVVPLMNKILNTNERSNDLVELRAKLEKLCAQLHNHTLVLSSYHKANIDDYIISYIECQFPVTDHDISVATLTCSQIALLYNNCVRNALNQAFWTDVISAGQWVAVLVYLVGAGILITATGGIASAAVVSSITAIAGIIGSNIVESIGVKECEATACYRLVQHQQETSNWCPITKVDVPFDGEHPLGENWNPCQSLD